MQERVIAIPAADGAIETFITHPVEGGPFAGVVIYMDIWGVREELFDIARRVATVGYYCMVPDFYYREGTVRYEFRDPTKRMISADRLDDQTLKSARASR